MDYERIQKPQTNAVGGGLSPRKLRNMLLGVDKKRREEDTDPDSATLDPEVDDSGGSISSDNCKDVDVINVGPDPNTKSERASQRVSLAPFSKPAPSKWDDAQKWIASPTSNRTSKSQEVGSQKPTLFGYGRQLSSKVVVEVVGEPDTKRIDWEVYPHPTAESAINLSQHDSVTIQSATTFIPPPSTARSVSMRDMGTEMTPAASLEPSRTGTPVKATTPRRSPSSSRPSTPPKAAPSSSPSHALSQEELQMQTRKEIIALGTQLGKFNIAAWASKEEENNNNGSRSSLTDKQQKSGVEIRAVSWEEVERAKYMARFKREEMRIEAWENHQKAKNEAEMRKVEVEVERIKGRAQDKLMNKVAEVRLKAEEKRAAAEAQRNRRAAKTEEQVIMKKMILRKCKSLSRQLGRSSSYSSLRSKSSTRDDFHYHNNNKEEAAPPPLPVHEHQVVIFVGSTRKPHVINSEYLDHPLLKSLIEKPDDDVMVVVKCEVVLFDHLLWMLDNNGADPDFISESSLEELANLYVF